MKRMFSIVVGAVLAAVAVSVCAGTVELSTVQQIVSVSPDTFGGFALLGETALAADLTKLEKAMKEAFDAMGVNLRKTQEVADTALAESKKLGGVIEGKTSDELKKLGENSVKIQGDVVELRKQLLETVQKVGAMPQNLPGNEAKTLQEIILAAPEWKAAKDKPNAKSMEAVVIGSFHKLAAIEAMKANIINAVGQNQPLVLAQRLAGIVTPFEQRLWMRDLVPAASIDTNLVEFAVEASFTSAARPQGDASPGGIEGESKAESAMTFSLSNAPVVTLAHWIPASRQILSDAKMLEGHIRGRLTYGLKLEEENEILTGNGTAGKLNGLCNQAAVFSGGATNQTVLDTILKAFLQVSLSNMEASGVVMHPTDWTNAMLLKDTQGRYLFSNPQDMVAPRLWAKPVVPAIAMTTGKFLVGAFNIGAQIWDREDANVRISENVNDHFIRNMVAVLAEERLALTVFRSTAFVYGDVSFAG